MRSRLFRFSLSLSATLGLALFLAAVPARAEVTAVDVYPIENDSATVVVSGVLPDCFYYETRAFQDGILIAIHIELRSIPEGIPCPVMGPYLVTFPFDASAPGPYHIVASDCIYRDKQCDAKTISFVEVDWPDITGPPVASRETTWGMMKARY